MANINNPRKSFNFQIFAAGLNPWLAQEVTIGEVTIEKVIHGDSNHEIKTGGMRKVGDINIKKLMPSDFLDAWLNNWIDQVQSATLGGGLLPIAYKRNLIIEMFGPDNISVVGTWEVIGAWPTRRAEYNLSRTSSDNIMEELDLACDDIRQIL